MGITSASVEQGCNTCAEANHQDAHQTCGFIRQGMQMFGMRVRRLKATKRNLGFLAHRGCDMVIGALRRAAGNRLNQRVANCFWANAEQQCSRLADRAPFRRRAWGLGDMVSGVTGAVGSLVNSASNALHGMDPRAALTNMGITSASVEQGCN